MARLVAVCCIGLVFGCAQRPSVPQHVEGLPVASASGVQWAASDEVLVKADLGEPYPYYPASHPAARRVQFWVDSMDAAFRAAYPEAMQAVPPPRVLLNAKPEANAFVPGVHVCYRVPVRVNPAALPDSRRDAVAFMPDSSLVIEFTPQYQRCLPGKDIEEVLAFYAQQGNRSRNCHPVRSADGEAVEFAGNCGDVIPQLERRADQFVTIQTAPFVVVYRGLLELHDEDTFVATLAHELGHFYRSHLTTLPDQIRYFYDETSYDGSGRPMPSSQWQALGERLVRWSSWPFRGHLAGERLYPGVFRAFLGASLQAVPIPGLLARGCGSDPSCAASCESVATRWNGITISSFLRDAPWEMTDERKAELLALEGDLMACAARLPIPVALGEHPLTHEFLAGRMPRYLVELRKADYDAAPPSTLLGALERWSEFFFAAEEQARSDYFAARRVGLGLYTHEQEADDFAVEALARVGVPPASAVEMILRMLKEERRAERWLDYADERECRSLRARGWPVEPPFGVGMSPGIWNDPHHGLCYRAFNMDREMQRHRYPNLDRPVAPGPAWAEILASLRDASPTDLGS